VENRTTAKSNYLSHLIATSVLLVAFVIAVSGCGSSGSKAQRLTKSQYRAKLVKINTRYKPRVTRLFFKLTTVDLATGRALDTQRCFESTTEFTKNLHEIVDSVVALKPPKEFESLQRRFLKEARTSIAIIDQAARETETGFLACGTDISERIYGLPSEMRAARIAEAVWAALGVRYNIG